MKLAADEMKNQFERDGFLLVPRLFRREEAQAFKREIQRVVQDVRAEAVQSGEKPAEVIRNGVYVGIAARSPIFREAVADERLLTILTILLGTELEFLSDKVVFKDAEKDYGSPWHQDWPYWQGSHKLSVWVALDDASPENGCMKFMPGSHRGLVAHDGVSGDSMGFVHRLEPGALDESKAVTAAIEAGGAAFFHDLALHSSYPNQARRDRWVWIPTYRHAIHDDPPYSWAVAARVVQSAQSNASFAQ